uniref:Uncharacterized protein n=1 Tax=Corethron hystrix TaxID=216773 RepID=A0A7S1BZJ9_9STRA
MAEDTTATSTSTGSTRDQFSRRTDTTEDATNMAMDSSRSPLTSHTEDNDGGDDMSSGCTSLDSGPAPLDPGFVEARKVWAEALQWQRNAKMGTSKSDPPTSEPDPLIASPDRQTATEDAVDRRMAFDAPTDESDARIAAASSEGEADSPAGGTDTDPPAASGMETETSFLDYVTLRKQKARSLAVSGAVLSPVAADRLRSREGEKQPAIADEKKETADGPDPDLSFSDLVARDNPGDHDPFEQDKVSVVLQAPAFALPWEERNMRGNVRRTVRTTFGSPFSLDEDKTPREQADAARVRSVCPDGAAAPEDPAPTFPRSSGSGRMKARAHSLVDTLLSRRNAQNAASSTRQRRQRNPVDVPPEASTRPSPEEATDEEEGHLSRTSTPHANVTQSSRIDLLRTTPPSPHRSPPSPRRGRSRSRKPAADLRELSRGAISSLRRRVRTLSRGRSTHASVRSRSLDSMISSRAAEKNPTTPASPLVARPRTRGKLRSLANKLRGRSRSRATPEGLRTPRGALLQHWTAPGRRKVPTEEEEPRPRPISIETLVQMQRDARSVLSDMESVRSKPLPGPNLPGLLATAEAQGNDARVLDRLGMTVVPRPAQRDGRRAGMGRWDDAWKGAASATFDDGEESVCTEARSIAGRFDVSGVFGLNRSSNPTPLRKNGRGRGSVTGGASTNMMSSAINTSVGGSTWIGKRNVFCGNGGDTTDGRTYMSRSLLGTKIDTTVKEGCMDCCDDEEMTVDSAYAQSTVMLETNGHVNSIRCMAMDCRFQKLQACAHRLSRWISLDPVAPTSACGVPVVRPRDTVRDIICDIKHGPDPYREREHLTKFTHTGRNEDLDFEETLRIFERTLRYHRHRGDKLEYVYYKCTSAGGANTKPISYVIV